MSHPLHRRIRAEELVRLRRSDERLRFAASQRRGRIDPNPHQIDAVLFALRRIRDGGCILADEVGLGKTIEAGLVVAQLLAEGARRIFLIVPKALLGQWKSELFCLFGLDSREGGPDPLLFQGPGIFVVGREFAGSERGSALLKSVERFDLCIIDEAHELFAGIYKRFERDGSYDPGSENARTAQRVRDFLGRTPVLLLTATPIQNNLTELWGLVQYVEPTGTLLGSIATFRDLFCEPASNDRVLVAGQSDELRRRINTVCQRTLRRQAQEFLERKFTQRRARLLEYEMSPAERSLHDDVTDYLLEPDLNAFRGSQRQLLLIGFLRQMASSWKALASSLKKVAARLRALLTGAEPDGAPAVQQAVQQAMEDLEGDDDGEEGEAEVVAPPIRSRVEAELVRVEAFIRRAEALPGDAKARQLLAAVRSVLARGHTGEGSGKVVIFTESLTTQDYIRDLLCSEGLVTEDEVTLFRGVNDTPRAMAAWRQWRAEVEPRIPPANRPSNEVAVRMGLVHEFKERSRVFISTESGAKGLNLQFCETLVNYDLPWNPQRIEQRIGRCHRYGQVRDVTVINFLAKENEAQRLTFEILSKKLELFGQVLDATDVVLHEPTGDAPETLATALGGEFERQRRRIWERARSQDEVSGDLRRLSDDLDAQRKRFEETQRKTASLIESRLDESVRTVFRKLQSEIPASLAELDREIELVVTDYLQAAGIGFERQVDEGRILLKLAPHESLPESLRAGGLVAIGHARQLEDVDPLHLGHPLLLAAVAWTRRASEQAAAEERIQFCPAAGKFEELRGRRGRMAIAKATHRGFEPFERLLYVAVLDNPPTTLLDDQAQELALAPIHSSRRETISPSADADHVRQTALQQALDDALDEAVFQDQVEAGEREQLRFRAALDQIDRYLEDQALVQRRKVEGLEERVFAARKARDDALGADARSRAQSQLELLESELETAGERLERLERRDDDEYRDWRQTAQRRRAESPELVRLLEFPFEVE